MGSTHTFGRLDVRQLSRGTAEVERLNCAGHWMLRDRGVFRVLSPGAQCPLGDLIVAIKRTPNPLLAASSATTARSFSTISWPRVVTTSDALRFARVQPGRSSGDR